MPTLQSLTQQGNENDSIIESALVTKQKADMGNAARNCWISLAPSKYGRGSRKKSQKQKKTCFSSKLRKSIALFDPKTVEVK